MRKTLALIALAIAGFTFGFAGCGDDDDGSPSDTATVPTFGDTTTDGTTTDGTSTEDTTTDGTSTDDTGARTTRTNEDDGGNNGKGGGGGDREPSPILAGSVGEPGLRSPNAATIRSPGRLAQLGEHQLDKLGVTGSSPVPPIHALSGLQRKVLQTRGWCYSDRSGE